MPPAPLSSSIYFSISSISVLLAMISSLSGTPHLSSSSSAWSPSVPVTALSSRIVETKFGPIRGFVNYMSDTRYGMPPVEVFLGIPYALPPVGNLRFANPMKPTPWDEVLLADRLSPVCPQQFVNIKNPFDVLKKYPEGRLQALKRISRYLQTQSEDCLYLNIYVPYSLGREPTRLPVMVFIHGESYEWNSGNPYDGSVLASYGNVLVVTINFRLGILGFLPPLEGSSRGNFGLMDQVAALHWIQENIAEFGGDPKNVTIFGQGYGAACVNLLMISPMAKGLFHRAIMQSGSALSPWAIADEGVAYTRQLARALGCPSDDNITMVTCLRERPLSELMRVEFKVPTHRTSFGPTVDGVVVPVEPLKAMERHDSLYGKYNLLFGVTKMEGYLHFSAFDERRGVEADKRDRLLRTLVRNLFNYHQQEIFLTVVNEYTDWTKSVQHPVNIFEGVSDALGDSLVVAPLVHAGNLHSRFDIRTFFYVFSHQTEEGDYNPRLGCIHGEELAYVFGAPLVGSLSHFPRNYTRTEVALSEAVMTYWTNFARYGDPNSPTQDGNVNNERGRGRFDRFLWPQYESVHQQYLTLGVKPKVKDHYHAHRLSIWMNLIPKLHQPGTFTTTPEHHLLENFDDPTSYDGIVRPRPLTIPTPTVFAPFHPATTGPELTPPVDPAARDDTQETVTAIPEEGALSVNQSERAAVVVVRSGGYSTALSVTIAIGCSLLILNVLVFAGVFYQRDKNRIEAKLQRRKYQLRVSSDGKTPSQDSPEKKLPPPDSPCCSPQSCHAMKFPSMSPVPPPSPNAVPVLPPRPVVNSAVPESQPLIGTGSFKKSVDSRDGGY